MDNNMMMDFLMKQQEIAAQQNLAFQQSQNSMMQLLAALMAQPQPNPMQQMPTPPNMQQTMALSNAAATPNLAEVNDLKAQIDALKQQLADAQAKMSNMQSQLEAANERASAAEAQAAQFKAQFEELAGNVSIVEAAHGRSMEEMLEEAMETTGDDYYSENREELTRLNGRDAHEQIKQAIDDRNELIKKYRPEDYEKMQSEGKVQTQTKKKKNPFDGDLVDF